MVSRLSRCDHLVFDVWHGQIEDPSGGVVGSFNIETHPGSYWLTHEVKFTDSGTPYGYSSIARRGRQELLGTTWEIDGAASRIATITRKGHIVMDDVPVAKLKQLRRFGLFIGERWLMQSPDRRVLAQIWKKNGPRHGWLRREECWHVQFDPTCHQALRLVATAAVLVVRQHGREALDNWE